MKAVEARDLADGTCLHALGVLDGVVALGVDGGDGVVLDDGAALAEAEGEVSPGLDAPRPVRAPPQPTLTPMKRAANNANADL
jgi:hypothetical protein